MRIKPLLPQLLLILSLFFITSNVTFAQKSKDKKKDKKAEESADSSLVEHQKKAAELIEFMSGTLNAIGSENTPVFEKQIMINNSFNKVFQDDKVQVEDDLDENREIYMYKDVQAYLQDIDFFFKNVKFDFKIEDVEHFKGADGDIVFKFKTTRHLKGLTIANDSMDSFQDRYIEINLNDNNQSLKIVSMYTTKLNESEEMLNWWNGLSAEWKKILSTKSGITEPVNYDKIKSVLRVTELDLSNNPNIADLEPLSKLGKLKRLDCSNTKVNDLYPIRNLNKLEVLNCSNTEIKSVSPLQYAAKMQDLFLDNTKISDIDVVENFVELKKLSIENTNVSNIESLIEASTLEDLRMSGTKVEKTEVLKELPEIRFLRFNSTPISSLSNLSNLKKLEQLSFSATKINDISLLSQFPNLKVVYFNNTSISDLTPLEKCEKIEKIYCDNTGIDEAKASAFMSKKPNSLVIYNSDILKKWWEDMSAEWKKVFAEDLKTETPGIEQLHRLSMKQDVSLAGKTAIVALDPVSKFTHLSKLDVSGSGISDLSPVKNLLDLQELNCSNTEVTKLDALSSLKRLVKLDCSNTQISSLAPVANCDNLEIINADKTQISNLTGLSKLTRLKKIYADNTQLTKDSVSAYKLENGNCLVIYRTEELKKWWTELDKDWQEVFKKSVAFNETPDREQLHQITMLKAVDLKDKNDISNLKPLEMLEFLESIKFTDTRISDLSPIANLQFVKELIATKSAISELGAISNYKNLETLDCSNSLISDLEPIENLKKLQVLKVSGTKVRWLKHIEGLKELIHLDISGTKVLSLDAAYELPKLKVLKCYNTKLMGFLINKFEKNNPNVEVVR
jgi:Leucine-rich repeat (LRR) protein